MGKVTYTLRYLPLFYSDLEEHVLYIAENLHNKDAANELINEVEAAILERLPNAESFEAFFSLKNRKNLYYRIYVNNFTIYYVVIPVGKEKKIMEVRRILHNLQERDRYI